MLPKDKDMKKHQNILCIRFLCFVFSFCLLLGAGENQGLAQSKEKAPKVYKCKKCGGLAKATPPDRPEAKECPKGGKCNFQPYVRSCSGNWYI